MEGHGTVVIKTGLTDDLGCTSIKRLMPVLSAVK